MKIKLTLDTYQEFIFPIFNTGRFSVNGFEANHANCDFENAYFTNKDLLINKDGIKQNPCLVAKMNGTFEVEIS